MIRVLIINQRPDRPEFEFLLELHRRGHYVEIAGLLSDAQRDRVREIGIPYTEIVFRNRFDLAGVRTLRKILSRTRFDLFHAFTARALSCANLATMFLPRSSATPATLGRIAYRGVIGNISRIDPTSWLTFLHPRLARVICLSNAVREYLVSAGVRTERAIRIYKGHRVEWYAANKTSHRAEFGIHASEFLIGCVGNMRRVKGGDVLLSACERLPREIPFRLMLIGRIQDPALQHQLEHSPIRDRIVALGFREDAPALMRMCDLTIVPSRSDALPKSIFEAALQAIPVVATRVGGIPEMVRDAQDALLVPPEDPTALADAILRMIQEPHLRAELGHSAHRYCGERFSFDTYVEETVRVYEEVVSSEKHPAELCSNRSFSHNTR